MLKNYKKIKILVTIIFTILILAVLAIEVVKLKGYYLIYNWVYFVITYMVLFLAFLLCSEKKYFKWVGYAVILILLGVNTKSLLHGNKMFLFKSPNAKNEIIIKEVVKNQEGVATLDLKRRFCLFGKKTDEYVTKNIYRPFSAGTYKVNWINDNIATVNYLDSNKDGKVKQHVYTFNFKEPISYNNVTPSITGIWANKENPNNKLTVENGKFIYVKDEKTFVYDAVNSEQMGYNAVVFKGEGTAPNLSIIFNEGSIIGSDCLLNKEATIFIGYVSLVDEKYGLFERIGGENPLSSFR